MNITPIHSAAEYKAALRVVSELVDLDPAPGTPDGDRLDIMATLVTAYEAREFPVDAADAVEAIKFRMEQQGVKELHVFRLPLNCSPGTSTTSSRSRPRGAFRRVLQPRPNSHGAG